MATNKIIRPRALPLKGVNAVCKAGPIIYAFVEMLTLYHNDMSVCAAKVRTALAGKKLAWNGVHLDLRRGDAQEPEYLKLNLNAVVPTLVHADGSSPNRRSSANMSMTNGPI